MAYDHRKTYPWFGLHSQTPVQPVEDAVSRMTFLDPHAANKPNGTTTLMVRKSSAQNSADLD